MAAAAATTTTTGNRLRHFLTASSFGLSGLRALVNGTLAIKRDPAKFHSAFAYRNTLLMFSKPSLRTRVSFEAGMTEMGGHAIYYPLDERAPLGQKENIHDTAKCASRFVSVIAARLRTKAELHELAQHATVPVINLLDDWGHPCQIIADLTTISEKREGALDAGSKFKLSFYGDGFNNVTYDLMRAGALLGWKVDVACPAGSEYEPCAEVLDECAELTAVSKGEVRVVHDPLEAARDSDVVYTDSWMSYGVSKEEEAARVARFGPYRVTSEIMAAAKKDALFMNCLPANRGHEQTAEVVDGPQSVVFDQAENRLHSHKAVVLYCLGLI